MRWMAICVTVASLGLAPARAQAQSLLAQGGLGVPLEQSDAMARGLGSMGIGLFGVSLTPADPAAAYSSFPTLTVSMQPTWGEFQAGDQTGDLQGQRFPILGASYPAGARGLASVTIGSFMDQRWRVESADTITLAGDERAVLDRFESDGGISTIRFGYAHRLSNRLVLAGNIGALTGQVTRSFGRQFDSTSVEIGASGFFAEGRWRWVGPAAALGVRWDPSAVLRLSGSVNWYGVLEAQPQDLTEGPTFEFDIPIELRAGGSAQLTCDLVVSSSVYYADWTKANASLAADSLAGGSSAASTLGFGAGIEFGGLGLLGRTFPVRAGYRRQELPFAYEAETPLETAWTGGLGLNLAQTDGLVLAKTDLAIERGTRVAGTLTERFWRLTISFHASGF